MGTVQASSHTHLQNGQFHFLFQEIEKCDGRQGLEVGGVKGALQSLDRINHTAQMASKPIGIDGTLIHYETFLHPHEVG